MLTFIHAPESRSTVIARLLEELGATDRLETRLVSIIRFDGSGAIDPSNPHPEGKVPALVHEGRVLTERAAIMAHLCALFPEAGLSPAPGSAEHGELLTWLTWYQAVMETVVTLELAGLAHPVAQSAFRGKAEAFQRLHNALKRGPWLLGARFSAADLLVQSLFAWMPNLLPEDPLIRDWSARVAARPAYEKVSRREAELRAAMG